MNEPIKLKQPGDQHVMDVASCSKLPFGDYPEFEFVGRDGSVVRVPEVSALRQLGNLELTPESVVGRRVKIKRDPNKKQPAKPYWGIYLEDGENGSGPVSAGAAGGATSAKAANEPRNHQPPAQAPEKEKLTAVYEKSLDFVLSRVLPKLQKAGVPVTHEGVSAMTSTVFIAANSGGRH